MTTDPDIIYQDTVNAARIFIAARIQRMGPGELADALADAGLLRESDQQRNERMATDAKVYADLEDARAELDKATAERNMAVGRVDEMRQQLGIEVRARDEWEANAERAMIERDVAQAERNEAQAEQDRLADIIKGLYETIDDERATIRKTLKECAELRIDRAELADKVQSLRERVIRIPDRLVTVKAERDEARATLDRVRAAADTLTWRNGYGDAQQIIYRAIVGEDQP